MTLGSSWRRMGAGLAEHLAARPARAPGINVPYYYERRLGFDPAAMMTAFVVDGLKSGGGDRGPAQQLKKSRAEDEDGS